MPARVTLERFAARSEAGGNGDPEWRPLGAGGGPARADAEPDAEAGATVTPGPPGAAGPETAGPAAAVAEPAPGPAMPADEPEAPPEREAAPSEEVARTAAIERLADALHGLGAEIDALRAEARTRAAACARDALVEALPALARAAFAEEAATAVAALAHTADTADAAGIELHLSEADHDRVLEAVAGRGVAPGLATGIGPDLAPGELRLTWPEGGAELSRQALARSLRDRIERALRQDETEEETAA